MNPSETTDPRKDDAKKASEPLDMLIVGGGPGGSAAAFRARELGMRALIIELDDLMKRIRDYCKDKLILPGFGGGDRMKFPKCGPLVSDLRFAPIDKDDMCAQWKALHRRHGVASKVGVELTGLERREDGVYRVLCWNHAARQDAVYLARHVVLAIGHGVPRRFDIPGNTDGVAFRLDDPARYVGMPTCVIGGGTSAAEAVIAISNAKVRAHDPTSVYWSYRGDRLPRVSKALADVFFEAYAGNGNIRYYPKSEPSAIVTAEDRVEYLTIRTDRRCMEGRPTETTHLEFPKTACIACIGEDVPETLLDSIGIHMVLGGPRRRKRMVVNRYLESVLPNVYMIGDLLSQAYFRTDDFTADSASFTEVKHRGNIKSALRDGVLVANVVKQRLDGKTDIEVHIEDDEDLAEPPRHATVAVPRPNVSGPPPAAAVSPDEASLNLVLPSGVIERRHPLPLGRTTTVGRAGDMAFPEDEALQERHVSVVHDPHGFWLVDHSAAGDIFLRARPAAKTSVKPGDLIRAGGQFLLIGAEKNRCWFEHYDSQGALKGKHWLSERLMVLGRDAPDLTLDPEDMTLSRRHLALYRQDGRIILKDLNSANGSYLRVRNKAKLRHGDQFQAGRQTLAFSEREDAVLDTAQTATPSRPAPAVAPKAPAEVLDGAPSVTFHGFGVFPAAPGQTICEVAEANGVPFKAECHAGVCGSDPIRVMSGAENLQTQPDDQEVETLEDICDLEPGPCRLACMARVKGPVTVEIIS